MTIIFTYASYFLVCLGLTMWVAQTLFKNGRVFLVDVFGGDEPLADAVNHLLVVGFYLICLGYISYALKIEGELFTARAGIEMLAKKLGTVMIVLGSMHFMNLIIFTKMRSAQAAKRRAEAYFDSQRRS